MRASMSVLLPDPDNTASPRHLAWMHEMERRRAEIRTQARQRRRKAVGTRPDKAARKAAKAVMLHKLRHGRRPVPVLRAIEKRAHLEPLEAEARAPETALRAIVCAKCRGPVKRSTVKKAVKAALAAALPHRLAPTADRDRWAAARNVPGQVAACRSEQLFWLVRELKAMAKARLRSELEQLAPGQSVLYERESATVISTTSTKVWLRLDPGGEIQVPGEDVHVPVVSVPARTKARRPA